LPLWNFEITAKKGCFLRLSGKERISPLLAPLSKFWKNPLVAPPLEKFLPTPMPTVKLQPHLATTEINEVLQMRVCCKTCSSQNQMSSQAYSCKYLAFVHQN